MGGLHFDGHFFFWQKSIVFLEMAIWRYLLVINTKNKRTKDAGRILVTVEGINISKGNWGIVRCGGKKKSSYAVSQKTKKIVCLKRKIGLVILSNVKHPQNWRESF